jgi:hypothetical protein
MAVSTDGPLTSTYSLEDTYFLLRFFPRFFFETLELR